MKNTDLLDQILDDVEKLAIQAFVENTIQYEAVKKVLLAGIYYNGTLKKGKPGNPLLNFAIGLAFNDPKLSNESVGADLRASIAGINQLEVGYTNLLQFKKKETPPKAKENPAR